MDGPSAKYRYLCNVTGVKNSHCLVTISYTLGPAYNEFGYNEHPATMHNFFSLQKEHF